MSSKPTQHDPSAEAVLKETFARNLRAARKRRRMTQGDVAERIGVSTPIYWRYEKARMWPSLETLHRILIALDVSADTLFGTERVKTGESGQGGDRARPPPEDPPKVRRLMRQLRQARESTRRIVGIVLSELEKRRKR